MSEKILGGEFQGGYPDKMTGKHKPTGPVKSTPRPSMFAPPVRPPKGRKGARR